MQFKERLAEDLARSGLYPEDMNIRQIGNSEKAATNTPFSTDGYVIPYFSMLGKPVPFYRVKLFDSDPKYKQPKEAPNHVYFPKGFYQAAQKSKVIFLTEGEKKACLATNRGYPCIAFGGVDSWRNRIVSLPIEGEMSLKEGKEGEGKKVKAKMPPGEEMTEDHMSPLALGLQDLLDYIVREDKIIVIVYDTDHVHGTNSNVQRAAAQLGFELRFRGIAFDKIRQIILPMDQTTLEKTALDDFLLHRPDDFRTLLQTCLEKASAFPRHPNIRDYLNKRLQKMKMSRKEMQQVAIAILSELDAMGLRLISKAEKQSYFFDMKTHKLMRTKFTGQPNELTETAFGQYLYQKFGLGAADHRVMQWIGSHFTGEEPISYATPYKVFARPDVNADCVYMQISDGEYVRIDADGLTIFNNGDEGILFEAEMVEPIDVKRLINEWMQQEKRGHDGLTNWWGDVLNEVRLKDKDKQRIMTSLLFYVSPWLYKWRGTQLPIEMTLGEAGSGKSTLQVLRLEMQTGKPKMRNAPSDMKDWYSSIVNAGGLHVTDNVQMVDKALRQRLSDEMCRMVTEPNPTVEMRKYYTNNDLLELPVNVIFGITAIQQPFMNTDIIQRSLIIELDKSLDLQAGNGDLQYDANWITKQLSRFGGREAWLAHHFYVLHLFFKEIRAGSWNMRYQSKHRLMNLEQIFIVMAKLFGIDASWIAPYLNGVTERIITDTDWAFEGIQAFGMWWYSVHKNGKEFTAGDMAEWASITDDFSGCEILINSRKLGKYLKNHKSLVGAVAGIYESRMSNNRQTYKIIGAPKERPSIKA